MFEEDNWEEEKKILEEARQAGVTPQEFEAALEPLIAQTTAGFYGRKGGGFASDERAAIGHAIYYGGMGLLIAGITFGLLFLIASLPGMEDSYPAHLLRSLEKNWAILNPFAGIDFGGIVNKTADQFHEWHQMFFHYGEYENKTEIPNKGEPTPGEHHDAIVLVDGGIGSEYGTGQQAIVPAAWGETPVIFRVSYRNMGRVKPRNMTITLTLDDGAEEKGAYFLDMDGPEDQYQVFDGSTVVYDVDEDRVVPYNPTMEVSNTHIFQIASPPCAGTYALDLKMEYGYTSSTDWDPEIDLYKNMEERIKQSVGEKKEIKKSRYDTGPISVVLYAPYEFLVADMGPIVLQFGIMNHQGGTAVIDPPLFKIPDFLVIDNPDRCMLTPASRTKGGPQVVENHLAWYVPKPEHLSTMEQRMIRGTLVSERKYYTCSFRFDEAKARSEGVTLPTTLHFEAIINYTYYYTKGYTFVVERPEYNCTEEAIKAQRERGGLKDASGEHVLEVTATSSSQAKQEIAKAIFEAAKKCYEHYKNQDQSRSCGTFQINLTTPFDCEWNTSIEDIENEFKNNPIDKNETPVSYYETNLRPFVEGGDRYIDPLLTKFPADGVLQAGYIHTIEIRYLGMDARNMYSWLQYGTQPGTKNGIELVYKGKKNHPFCFKAYGQECQEKSGSDDPDHYRLNMYGEGDEDWHQCPGKPEDPDTDKYKYNCVDRPNDDKPYPVCDYYYCLYNRPSGASCSHDCECLSVKCTDDDKDGVKTCQ